MSSLVDLSRRYNLLADLVAVLVVGSAVKLVFALAQAHLSAVGADRMSLFFGVAGGVLAAYFAIVQIGSKRPKVRRLLKSGQFGTLLWSLIIYSVAPLVAYFVQLLFPQTAEYAFTLYVIASLRILWIYFETVQLFR